MRLRNSIRLLGTAFAILAISLMLVEVVLQVAARFAGDRAGASREGARYTVLCIGDSHTYGAGVPAEESYPAHLQRLLDETAPGAYTVLNFGLPGMNTAQVLERLPAFLRHYEPDVVLVWVGVDNSWNHASAPGAPRSPRQQLERLVSRARTLRLVQVLLHDRRMHRERAASKAGRAWEVVSVEDAMTGRDRYTLRLAEGSLETVQHAGEAEASAGDEWQAGAEADYSSMVQEVRSAGARIAFVSYPLDEIGVAAVANRAIERVTAQQGVPLVRSRTGVLRVPAEERNFLWAAHPDGRLYGEIARDIRDVVLELRPAEQARD